MNRKIAIIGYSGSGKSTLARNLGKIYNCPVLHLDCVYWLPGWLERDSSESNEIVSGFLDAHENWVIDGNYQSICFRRRMNEADLIIFLDFPMHVCLFRALKRYFTYRGKSRKSITEGCDEKIDWEFFWWIVHKGRNRAKKEWYRNIHTMYHDKTVVLKSPKSVRNFLRWLNHKLRIDII